MTYKITTLNPAPLMTESVVSFDGSYEGAVAAAQKAWRETGRPVRVVVGTFTYHYVTREGVAIDSNVGSGIPASQQLLSNAGARWPAAGNEN